jgi:cobalt-zinc-cadmium efflux system protein
MEVKNRKALIWSAILTGSYFVFELIAGLIINSIAIISDAFHTFSAVGGVLIALIAAHYATKHPTERRTFGFFRAEIFGAFVNGVLLIGMAVLIMWMGYKRLKNPISIPPIPMLMIAGGGLITEIISLRMLFGGQKTNLNMKGAFWHVVETFIGSLVIIIAAIVIKFSSFYAIDPILGMGFGVVLFWASYSIIKDSVNILLQATPKGIDLKKIKEEIDSLPYVKETHHIHAWTLTSGKNIFTAHVLVEDIKKADKIIEEINKILREKYNFYFTTIQIEDKYIAEEPLKIDYIR